MTASGTLPFASAERVVNRIHRYATGDRASADPSVSPRFSERNIFMLKVAHLSNGGIAVLQDKPYLSRRKFDMGVLDFLGHQLAAGSRASDDLASLSDFALIRPGK